MSNMEIKLKNGKKELTNKSHISNGYFIFTYNISEREQQIHVVITFDLTDSSENEQKNGIRTSNQIYNTDIYCIHASYDILDSLMSKGVYQTPK